MNQRWIIVVLAVVLAAGIGWFAVTHIKGQSSAASASAAPVNQLLAEAAQYEANGDKLKVKAIYEKIIADYPDYDQVAQIQDKLGDLNISIITSNIQTPQTVEHEVVPGDSLGKLAKQYNTTPELIKKSNGLKSDVIRVGQTLRIWNAPFSVLVSKSQNTLELKSGDEVIKIYHVSTGVNNSTPVGTFKIATKIANPVWFKPNSAPIPPESPDNQLGSRWMGFDVNPHYGIHGTIKPNLVGQQATAGCVRLVNAQVEELFDLLPVGTPIVIQN